MLDSFDVPRSGKSGAALSVAERLDYLREELASAEARQTAVLEAARAYRVSKEHYYRATITNQHHTFKWRSAPC